MNLELREVTHRYGAATVLRDISLTVRAGEIVCILGPSGCGKSALLRLLGGLEQPSEGQVLQSGEMGNTLNPLTFVFQDCALLPWRTVAGNISFVLEHHPLSALGRRRLIEEALLRAGLSGFADALPRQLSPGLRRRVGLARALAVRPAVILMDDPLATLDTPTRAMMTDELVRLWLGGEFTAVYATHDPAIAVRLAHRVVTLSRAPGSVQEVIAVDTPIARRAAGGPELAALSSRLQYLLRLEAEAVERDPVHA